MASATKPQQSFVPAPEPDEYVPDLREAVESPGERMKLAKLIHQHHDLGQEISKHKKIRDRLTKSIKDLLGKNKVKKCLYDGLSINYFCTVRETLDKALLLEHIDADTLKACTKETPTYTLTITKLKGEGDEEE